MEPLRPDIHAPPISSGSIARIQGGSVVTWLNKLTCDDMDAIVDVCSLSGRQLAVMCVFGAAYRPELVNYAVDKGLARIIVYVDHESIAARPISAPGLSIQVLDGGCRYSSDTTGDRTEPSLRIAGAGSIPLLSPTVASSVARTTRVEYKALTGAFRVLSAV